MSEEKEVGKVVETATPREFLFRAAAGEEIALHDYVRVPVKDAGEMREVLAEVTGLGAKNQLAKEAYDPDVIMPELTYKLLEADVLGYYDDEKKRVIRPRSAPNPGSSVWRAETDFLKKFFTGDEKRMPIYIGRLMNNQNVDVPIYLNDFQFHCSILASTRAGKSFLTGKIIEEILQTTPFPCVVLDMHGDYIQLDVAKNGGRHGKFSVEVYHPPGAPIEDGITAKMKSLDLSPADMTEEQIVALINAVAEIGGLQETAILNVVDELKALKNPFTLTDIISLLTESMNEKNEKDKYVMPNEDRTRVAHIVVRLQRLQKTLKLPSVGMSAADMLEPNQVSVICLAGLQSKVQDAYAGIILDQIFKYMVEHKKEAPPVFVFIEEAHRIASSTGKTDFAGRTISTIIREGAKFKIFLTLISQRPRSIDPDILANVGNVIALRITNEQDQQTILAASESFSKRLVEDLPRLNQGEAVVVGPFVPQAAHIQSKPRETVHHGASADLWEEKERLERKKKQKSNGKIKW